MSKTKKITFNMVSSDIAKSDTVEIVFNGVNKEFVIQAKRILEFKDAVNFVRDVADSCFDNETDSYNPEAYDFALKTNALIYYGGFTMPTDFAKAYKVVYETDLFERVFESAIDRRQWDTLTSAIQNRIDFYKNSLIMSQASKVGDLISRMDQMLSDSNKAIAEISSPAFKDKIDDMVQVLGYAQGQDYEEEEESVVVDDSDDDKVVVLPRP